MSYHVLHPTFEPERPEPMRREGGRYRFRVVAVIAGAAFALGYALGGGFF